MISSIGARTTAAIGTVVWGWAVASSSFFLHPTTGVGGITLSMLVGGLGVGWTYLAVIILVGHGLPNSPLARSFIGSMGFSSGTAVCLALDSYLGFESLGAERISGMLKLGGIICTTVGAGALVLLPSDVSAASLAPDQSKAPASFPGRFFSILLFFSALPGMAALATLLPVAAAYTQGHVHGSPAIFPYCTIALATEGLLGPLLSRLGAKKAFFTLFYSRAASLIALSSFPSALVATVTFVVILLGHGAGFNVLPILIKSQLGNAQALFPRIYSRILVTWGAAGLVEFVGRTLA
jgi:hypothetical protein